MLRGSRQLVSDLLATSWACRACHQQVAGKLATFRASRHVKMVWSAANKSPASRRVGLVEFDERHDKRANGQETRQPTTQVSTWKWRHCYF